MSQLDKNIAVNLKRIRKSRNMSLDIVAEKTGVSKSMLGQIERGERALSAKTLKKVVKYTGISADYLLFGKDSNNETIQKINNILTVNSETTSDFIYHIVMCSNDFCKKIKEENEN